MNISEEKIRRYGKEVYEILPNGLGYVKRTKLSLYVPLKNVEKHEEWMNKIGIKIVKKSSKKTEVILPNNWTSLINKRLGKSKIFIFDEKMRQRMEIYNFKNLHVERRFEIDFGLNIDKEIEIFFIDRERSEVIDLKDYRPDIIKGTMNIIKMTKNPFEGLVYIMDFREKIFEEKGVDILCDIDDIKFKDISLYDILG